MATRERREAIDAVSFLEVYAPLARAGKSALEIGKELGLTGDENKIAAYVSVKASSLRKALKQEASIRMKELGLKGEDANKLWAIVSDRVPKMKRGARSSGNGVSFAASAIAEALAELDAEE